VHIETSGAYPLSGTWDWICLSPKKKQITRDGVQCSHELKVIIHNKHDFVFAEEQAELVNNEAILFYNLSGAKKRNDAAYCRLCDEEPKMESVFTNINI
jgi:hypothetical protein